MRGYDEISKLRMLARVDIKISDNVLENHRVALLSNAGKALLATKPKTLMWELMSVHVQKLAKPEQVDVVETRAIARKSNSEEEKMENEFALGQPEVREMGGEDDGLAEALEESFADDADPSVLDEVASL